MSPNLTSFLCTQPHHYTTTTHYIKPYPYPNSAIPPSPSPSNPLPYAILPCPTQPTSLTLTITGQSGWLAHELRMFGALRDTAIQAIVYDVTHPWEYSTNTDDVQCDVMVFASEPAFVLPAGVCLDLDPAADGSDVIGYDELPPELARLLGVLVASGKMLTKSLHPDSLPDTIALLSLAFSESLFAAPQRPRHLPRLAAKLAAVAVGMFLIFHYVCPLSYIHIADVAVRVGMPLAEVMATKLKDSRTLLMLALRNRTCQTPLSIRPTFPS